MSLLLLACNCGNSTPLLRSFLRGAGVSNYLEVPLLKGNKAKEWAYQNGALPDLAAYLKKTSSFAVIVGLDPTAQLYDWVDINHHSLAHKTKATELIRTFSGK